MVPMTDPDKWQYHLPPEDRVNWLHFRRFLVFGVGIVAAVPITLAIAVAIHTNGGARAALDRLWPSELIGALLITFIAFVGGGVSLAVFELIRYLIRKRRAANIVLLDPPQAEIEFWNEDDRRYEQAKARLLQRQKNRGEDS